MAKKNKAEYEEEAGDQPTPGYGSAGTPAATAEGEERSSMEYFEAPERSEVV